MTYLGNRCGKHYDLVQLANPLHKLVDAWTLDHVHIVILALDFNRNCKVGLVQYLGIVSMSFDITDEDHTLKLL